MGTNGGVVFLDLVNNEILGKIVAGPQLPGNSVRTIDGHNGDIFVGTDDGLSINPHDAPVTFTKQDDAMFQEIRDVSWGIDDVMYLSTFGFGVGVVGPDTTYRITREDSLLGNKVFATAQVDTGRTYFATSLGLCAYRDSAWVGFQAGAGLPRGSIEQMIGVGEDRFYVLIRGRGIYRFNHSRSVRIRTGEVLGDDQPAVIAIAAALNFRELTDEGDCIDVSIHEAVSTCTEVALPYYIYNEAVVQRQTGRHAGTAKTPPWLRRTKDNRYVKAFLFWAGREVRVLVQPDQLDDLAATKLARDVVKKIEDNLDYPGQIKVTVIRETRAISFAR